MIKLSYTIITNETVEKISKFFSNIDKYYLQLSKGHKKFELVNENSLIKGASIQNEETAGGQYLKHRYEVVKVIENRFIKLISDPSTVIMWGILKLPVKVTVEFEMQSMVDKKTKVFSCLTLEFKNKVGEFLAKIVDTEGIWQAHLKEEME